MLPSHGISMGWVLEKIADVAVVILKGCSGGNTGVVAPTGPTTSVKTAFPPAVQPPEVCVLAMVRSIPPVGSNVVVPKVPRAGTALAGSLMSKIPTAATTAAKATRN